jgi:ribonuclease HI
MIIAVDGACPGNGTDKAWRSAFGVYLGNKDYVDNLAFCVPDAPGYAHTNQRAELYAALAALQYAERFAMNGGQWLCEFPPCSKPCTIRHLVIKSNSTYLVNSMTSHIHKWRSNGGKTAKRTPVQNQDLGSVHEFV